MTTREPTALSLSRARSDAPHDGARRGILFDFDGVLAQTMEDHCRAWQRVFAQHAVALASEDYYLLEGMPLAGIAETLCRKYGVDAAHAITMVQEKERYYLDDHMFRFYPAVETTIDELSRQRVPIAVVSAGLRKRLLASAPEEVMRKFDAIITGDDTTRGKPFPDPYLKGAAMLGLDIRHCIVVENAPLGVAAAKAAGAHCIAICSTLSSAHLAAADEVFHTFSEAVGSATVRAVMDASAKA